VFDDPDPDANGVEVQHGLNLIDQPRVIRFADCLAEDYQDRWDDVVWQYNLTPPDVIASREHGKIFWGYLTRKRVKQPEVLVLADNGNRISESVAYAVCECLHLDKGKAVYAPAGEYSIGREPTNQHVFDVFKNSRHLVVG
jgi:hypothetical protein